MKVQRLATATMVALTVGGLASLGSGTAFADTRGANAYGGSSSAADALQQNTAQQGRQNNHCASPNNSDPVDLQGARVKGKCVTTDGSFTELSEFRGGGANAVGGSSEAGLIQQNTAQRGQQNNNCSNPDQVEFIVSGGRLESVCEDTDNSTNHKVFAQGGGADANGGSAGSDLGQQNTAQEGRQNNDCDNTQVTSVAISGSSSEAACTNEDASDNKLTWSKGGGSEVDGGSSTGAQLFQRNTAQQGRQNNHCASPHLTPASGGNCANGDESSNENAWSRGGGARAGSGSTPAFTAIQKNTAQEGRQNNNCGNPQYSQDALGGGCENADASTNHRTAVKGRGAEASGGDNTGAAYQRNTAQEGRQNNHCDNPNIVLPFDVSGGSADGDCTHEDNSFSHRTLVKGGGAEANGGSNTGGDIVQQNTAQEGRQNNNCANHNAGSIEVTGGRFHVACGTTDNSADVRTSVTSGGAQADGGASAGRQLQQNTAQEGRQNNNCGNPNNLAFTLSGGRATAQCTATDESRNIDSDYR
ncbi:hypothetical protein [Streptomyces sp. NPDC048639]|uniref:hypothetical protein n=1 Tax=Streptomyces sp. NPDC048639 TaxID=3365581 RepID=UPI003713C775